MDRRAFIVGGIAAIAPPVAAEAQQTRKVYRLAFLAEGPTLAPHYRAALEGGLELLGYRVGDRVTLEYHYGSGDADLLRREAAGFVRRLVDMIITNTNPATSAAQQATNSIPIVMVAATNVIQAGFVQSLARPGGNITGLTADPAPETILGKQLSLLREVRPTLSRVSVLWNPTVPGYRHYLATLQAQASAVGIELASIEFQIPSKLEAAFEEARDKRAEALFILVDILTFVHRQPITELATKYRLPTVAYLREFAEAGGLLTYGVDLVDLYGRAAYYVDKILKGAKPADLPVEQPTKFTLVINLRPPRRSASRSRRRCCCGRTRS